MDEKRPDPGQLLRKLQYEEEEKQKKAKGKLKIFLGYAAGSGKTYAMLELRMKQKTSGGCGSGIYRTPCPSGHTGNDRGAGSNSAPYGGLQGNSASRV